MKLFKKILAVCVIAAILIPAGIQTVHAADTTAKTLDILFTHDTHSHLNEFITVQDNTPSVVGGFSRIKTVIDAKRSENPDTLILDGGDYSMGTLVQTIYSSDSAELRMLGNLGCEVTTLGNHEFDYRTEGLVQSLNAAKASGDSLPEMVLCNIDWETMEQEGLTSEQQALKDAFNEYGMKDYITLMKGDVKVAVFGVFGKDSWDCAPTCVLKFRDISEAAAETVAEIKEKENPDIIVCVSHSGTSQIPSKSEDEILAKKVPGIDVIISAHSHTYLNEAIHIGNTYVVSCGEYGRTVGDMSLKQKSDGRWELASYELLPITPAIAQDPPTQQKIDSFMEIVDSAYLSDFGYSRRQLLAQNDIVFSTSPDLYNIHTEHNLGNILADSLRYTVSNADTGDGHPIDLAIVPSGCVRDTFAVGDITVEDVYNVYSLGIGPDGISGYPLISVYLTGKELKTAAEIDASMSDLMNSARLFISGMNFTFNPHRLLLNKVTEAYLTDYDGNRIEIENDKLYRVVCDLYSGQMLGAVNDVSMGILTLQPKFADGTPIENIEDAIIYCDGNEIKAWAAIANYIGSFEDTDGDGIGNVPAGYGAPKGRKVVMNSWNPIELVKKPNLYAVVIVLVVLILIALIVTIIIAVIKLIKRILRKDKKVDKKKKVNKNKTVSNKLS